MRTSPIALILLWTTMLAAAGACGPQEEVDETPGEPDCGVFGCNSVPPTVCDGDDLIVSAGPGTCVADDVCEYTEEVTACEYGCEEDACIDLCVGIECEEPPEDACDGHTLLRYADEGLCEAGECVYPPEVTDCTEFEEICVVDMDDEPECREPDPTCDDGRENANETDTDCGGSDCLPCEVGQRCREAEDCASEVCDDRTCVEPSCRDRILNQDESDVDCGGTACVGCDAGELCLDPEDCMSGVCGLDDVCRLATCTDGVTNGEESDIDCGGTCPPCANGLICLGDVDCVSRYCGRGLCTDPTCDDRAANADETGVDCGGPDCGPCPNGEPCAEPTDCQSTVCGEGMCLAPTCTDGAWNGSETSTDCGGGGCLGCIPGDACGEPRDCLSGVCADSLCWDSTCEDLVRNGDETDLDCGGPECGPCMVGARCRLPSDCTESVCLRDHCVAPTCTDGVRNGTETDFDCGGPDCDGCHDGQSCADSSDCLSGFCTPLGLCRPEPSCDDSNWNGDETDVDCGGPICEPCGVGRGCEMQTDCVTLNCTIGRLCGPVARCDDRSHNGNETDRDCGGDVCPPCDPGDGCLVGDDCSAGVCDDGTCAEASCDDGVANGDETDLDCGGGTCGPCDAFAGCLVDDDCISLLCQAGEGAPFCTEASCFDSVQNGDETAIDCGGTCGGTPCPEECAEEVGVIVLNTLPIGTNEWGSDPDAGVVFTMPVALVSRFEPACAPARGGSPEAVFRFTAPESGDYLIVTGSSLDTIVSVLDESCTEDATVLACNDNGAGTAPGSRLGVTLTVADVVFIVVDGFGPGARGEPFDLTVTYVP